MSSVDHSTADAMKPSISKGYHLGSVNSSLVNLYLTPPCPSLSPSCVTLSSHLSAGPYPFIKAQLTCLLHIYSTYTNVCVCISSYKIQVSMSDWLWCSSSLKNYNSQISVSAQYLLNKKLPLNILVQSMSQHLFHVEKGVSCLSSKGMCSLRELLSNNYGERVRKDGNLLLSCILHAFCSLPMFQMPVSCARHTLSIIFILQFFSTAHQALFLSLFPLDLTVTILMLLLHQLLPIS